MRCSVKRPPDSIFHGAKGIVELAFIRPKDVKKNNPTSLLSANFSSLMVRFDRGWRVLRMEPVPSRPIAGARRCASGCGSMEGFFS